MGDGSLTYSEEESDLEKLFEEWMTKHGRIYGSEEEKELRFNTFKQCVKRLNEHNKTRGISWIMGLNQFSDYTSDEFASGFLGCRRRTCD
uniref:Cathepsin propeptide inhibitor domain-containing protein n=1 Tax=Kalanchoe fedtschenkoi TaxID=63787 RepID=A0A7N1A753_KALFE